MHIDDVVLGANSLGLYQLVEMGEAQNRNDLSRFGFSVWSLLLCEKDSPLKVTRKTK